MAQAKREAQEATGEYPCASCGALKPISGFPKGRKTRNGNQRYGYCRPCHTAYARKHKLKRDFNLTSEDYATILAHQNGVCALCKNPPRTKSLNVDHNHKTGLIRGLLCPFCNRSLGLFRDDAERVLSLYHYMQNAPATMALGAPRFGLIGRVTNKAATRRRLNKATKTRSLFTEA